MIVSSRHVVTSKPPWPKKISNKSHHRLLAMSPTRPVLLPSFATMASSIKPPNIRPSAVRWVELLNQFFASFPSWWTKNGFCCFLLPQKYFDDLFESLSPPRPPLCHFFYVSISIFACLHIALTARGVCARASRSQQKKNPRAKSFDWET